MKVKFCLIIPCYEAHAKNLDATLGTLKDFHIDLIVVDDGSSSQYANKIQSICEKFNASLIINKKNGGKGSALKLGFKFALKSGYSHALQVDADGQHDISSLESIIKTSKEYPNTLISGRPVYDESIPKKRLYGRYLTHVWVWIETLSFSLKDSMCGFRSYPLQETVKVIENHFIGNHMDFDTDIMVKLYWSGVKSKFLPVRVVYPEGGESYFRMFDDNVLITKMHTRLVFGMIIRFPLLLFKKFYTDKWSRVPEKGVVSLIKLTSWIQDTFGERLVHFVLKLISMYYYLFAFNARKGSSDFIRRYNDFCLQNNIKAQRITIYGHIYSFAKMILDKFSVWKGKITFEHFNKEDVQNLHAVTEDGKGALFISSHYGNIELIRALGRDNKALKYNALIYTENSQKMFRILKEIDPEVEDRIIFVEKIGPDLGIKLQEKISKGEWIFCMADRVTAMSNRVINADLLGDKVSLPQGPLIMSYLLDAPVYTIHCYREKDSFRLKIKDITPDIEKKKSNRDLYMKSVANSYAKELQTMIISDPKQWFNFYRYWKRM